MTKGEDTRRDIIRKAAPIFNQKGFHGAALSDLMEATGLEKGGIYRHFDSKEDLAAEAFDHAWQTVLDIRLAGLEQIDNRVDRLRQMIRNFRERREGLVPGGCPLLNTAIDSDDGNARLRARALAALEGWKLRLKSCVREGKRRGEVRPEVNAEELSTLIVSTLEGSLMLARLTRSDEPLRAAGRHLEAMLESSVRSKKP